MSVIKIIALALIGLIVLLLVKNSNASISAVLRIVIVVAILALMLPDFKELFSAFKLMEFPEGVSVEALKTVFKIFGILCTGSVGGDICRDNGENALGNVVEMCVKVTAVILSLPVITGVIAVAASFMNS